METIKLSGMLPSVFREEKISDSDIWRSELIFKKGLFYRIESASGGGKSSLCAYIYGSRNDYDGNLFFDDRNVNSLSISEWQEIRRNHIAYLPQELSLFSELTAMENILLKNDLTGEANYEAIERWLVMLGIENRKNTPVGRMSIGQQQRVGIVRALCQPFDFLLLDEPVSHLDAENNRIASKLIMEVATEKGAGIITTSVGNPLMIETSQIRL